MGMDIIGFGRLTKFSVPTKYYAWALWTKLKTGRRKIRNPV